MANRYMHNTVGGVMTPVILITGAMLGVPLTMTSVFTICKLIGRLHWPLNMMPDFIIRVKETARSMSRLQKFHMLYEVQEGMIKEEESSWGRNSLEVKGNFSWGF